VKQVDLILQDKLVFDQNYINPKMKYIQTKKLIFIKIKIQKIFLTIAVGKAAPAKRKSRNFCNNDCFSGERVFEPKKKLIIHIV
jgi:hypothetical protein